MRLVGHIARTGRGDTCKVLVGKPQGKRPLEIPRSRWHDNIETAITTNRTVGHGLDLSSLRQCFCEFGNETSGYITLISFAKYILKEGYRFPACHRAVW